MEIIISLLAIIGLAYSVKELDGPFDLFTKGRSYLLNNKHVGVFFYKLFSCWLCVGFHAGWIIYLLSNKNWSLNLLFCWGLAGTATGLILNEWLARTSPPTK